MTKNEQTEVGLAPKVETEAIHAWGLDYDDPDEFPTQPTRMTPRRITAMSLAVSLVLIAVAGAVALFMLRQPGSTQVAVPPAATVALPDEPPPNSGCPGAVVGHSDVKHPQLGMVRVFLFLDSLQSAGPHDAGCILPVTQTGKVLSAIAVDAFVGDGFGFANPATDTTGNVFIKYQDSSNLNNADGGVVVLVPNTDGYEHVISYQKMLSSSDGFLNGVNDYYSVELIGPVDGVYAIRQSMNTCNPYCAAGNLIVRNLHWDGKSYVPDAAQTQPPPSPLPAPAPPPPPPPPVATPTAAPTPSFPKAHPSSEDTFVTAVRGYIPTAYIPGGRVTDAQLVTSGYEACRVMAQYPDNTRRAAAAFYEEYGFNVSTINTEYPMTFMSYATMLCNPEG